MYQHCLCMTFVIISQTVNSLACLSWYLVEVVHRKQKLSCVCHLELSCSWSPSHSRIHMHGFLNFMKCLNVLIWNLW